MTQGELFPSPYVAPKARPKRTDGRVTYTKVAPRQTRQRRHCDDCIALIHQHGQGGAPYPMGVRWRRTEGADVRLLCEQHKRERQGGNDG